MSFLGKIDFSSLLRVRFAVEELSKKTLLRTSVVFVPTNLYQLIDMNVIKNKNLRLDCTTISRTVRPLIYHIKKVLFAWLSWLVERRI